MTSPAETASRSAWPGQRQVEGLVPLWVQTTRNDLWAAVELGDSTVVGVLVNHRCMFPGENQVLGEVMKSWQIWEYSNPTCWKQKTEQAAAAAT